MDMWDITACEQERDPVNLINAFHLCGELLAEYGNLCEKWDGKEFEGSEVGAGNDLRVTGPNRADVEESHDISVLVEDDCRKTAFTYPAEWATRLGV
ncbi:MAG: hypothetical protein JWM95_1798 [Gemmatimonadetes bacterium]|nr:hypothetical protein [Gemmatimonadota bacterium]